MFNFYTQILQNNSITKGQKSILRYPMKDLTGSKGVHKPVVGGTLLYANVKYMHSLVDVLT